MFERPQSGELAALVHVNFPSYDNEADLREFIELAKAAGAIPTQIVTATRVKPDPTYFIGKGKLEELVDLVQADCLEIIIFNHDLSPAQERNLERATKCRVLSRTGLILDIFAQRARTFEGKLQVELAQLRHLSTRLIRGWTHLERQKGGIGLRGPGETQLETDRRLLRQRIKAINHRLEKVRSQRNESRKKREKLDLPTVSLVGYTNAGKSTLFNQLTSSDVYVANQLFATLDPTLRTIHLPSIGKVALVDTVGFVSNLPHDLVDAFRATLEETRAADLLIHVVDRHDPHYSDTMHEVNLVLDQIGASDVPQLVVYNKIDLDDDLNQRAGRIDRGKGGLPRCVWVSALKQTGFEQLLEAIQEHLAHDIIHGSLLLKSAQGAVRAKLFELGAVLSEEPVEEGWRLEFKLSAHQWNILCHQDPGLIEALENK